MKVLSVEVWNFCSYPHLKFEFDGVGLALIYGPTGAGKSTLMDVTPWILYGETGKSGGVDEVRSWQAMEEPTKGVAIVQSNGVEISIHRIRGAGGKNDLFWTRGEDQTPQRGSTLQDTQRRLETILSCSVDAYLSGSYFHEFSPTSTFFKDRSKAQRALLEAVAPLDFAISLSQKASEARKTAKEALDKAEKQESILESRLEALNASKEDSERRLTVWNREHQDKVKNYTTKFNNFERDKETRIAKLTESLLTLENQLEDPRIFTFSLGQLAETAKCPTCTALRPEVSSKIAELKQKKTANEYKIYEFKLGTEKLRDLNAEVNSWAETLAELKQEINPFIAQISKLDKEIFETYNRYSVQLNEVEKAKSKVSHLTTVYDLSFELRGRLLTQAVQEIQDSTNRYLHDYFDAEIKVEFSIKDSDSLEVRLQKSGYDCVYTQLSKGQRGLLKLAFGISVMKASANVVGLHFDTLFFDEALDGLDSNLKVKAFRLFEELASQHQNVLVIDHSPELQNLFETQFKVSLVGDKSEMERSAP